MHKSFQFIKLFFSYVCDAIYVQSLSLVLKNTIWTKAVELHF